jgi:hypothetical protein
MNCVYVKEMESDCSVLSGDAVAAQYVALTERQKRVVEVNATCRSIGLDSQKIGSDAMRADKKWEIATTGANKVVSIVNVIVLQSTKKRRVRQSCITPAESQNAGKKHL